MATLFELLGITKPPVTETAIKQRLLERSNLPVNPYTLELLKTASPRGLRELINGTAGQTYREPGGPGFTMNLPQLPPITEGQATDILSALPKVLPQYTLNPGDERRIGSEVISSSRRSLLPVAPGTGLVNPLTAKNEYTQPFKSLTHKWETYYDKNGDPHTIDTNEVNPKPTWSSDRPLQPLNPNWRVFYDENGDPVKIDLNKENPKPGWSSTKPTQPDRVLADIKSSYEKAIGRANSAKMGVDIMSEAMGEEKDVVARQEYERAYALAEQYGARGGDLADLGITPESIRSDYQSGKITKEQAIKLLMDNY